MLTYLLYGYIYVGNDQITCPAIGWDQHLLRKMILPLTSFTSKCNKLFFKIRYQMTNKMETHDSHFDRM